MKTSPSSRRQHGFTLVEIMVVIVILGLLAGLVVPNVLKNTEEARQQTATSDITNLYQTIKLFVAQRSKIPTWEDLTTPDSRGQATLETGIPKDPWQNEYVIRNLEGYNRYEVICKGPDGIEDTEDDLAYPPRQE